MTEFKGFIGYEDDEFKNLWSDSIFVVDTNVLINFFKYTSSDSTNSLMKVLRYLKDSNRLWIPHQVALEYFFNYEKNMNKQMDAHSEIHQLKNNLADELKQKISKFRSDHPYISVNTNAKLDEYLSEIEKVGSNLEQTIETEVANMSNPESIHNDILSILKGIVGDPYSQNKIDTIETQGVDRYKYSIPPGFKDQTSNKGEFRVYGNFKYQLLYGDLIMWNQIIDKAKEIEKGIILITEERKEDWWSKSKGKIIRPHPQLIHEFLYKTDKHFYMYRTERFLQMTSEFLEVDLVSASQIENVEKDIELIRKNEKEVENSIETLPQLSPTIDKNKLCVDKIIEKEISFSEIKNFLKQNEINDLQHKYSIALEESQIDFHPKRLKLAHENLINSAIKQAYTRIESEFKKWALRISGFDINLVQEFYEQLNICNEYYTSIESAKLMIFMIEEMEHEFEYNYEYY